MVAPEHHTAETACVALVALALMAYPAAYRMLVVRKAVEPWVDVSVCQTAGLEVAAAFRYWACVVACVPLSYVTGPCSLECVKSFAGALYIQGGTTIKMVFEEPVQLFSILPPHIFAALSDLCIFS